jgi:hypothetical protein
MQSVGSSNGCKEGVGRYLWRAISFMLASRQSSQSLSLKKKACALHRQGRSASVTPKVLASPKTSSYTPVHLPQCVSCYEAAKAPLTAPDSQREHTVDLWRQRASWCPSFSYILTVFLCRTGKAPISPSSPSPVYLQGIAAAGMACCTRPKASLRCSRATRTSSSDPTSTSSASPSPSPSSRTLPAGAARPPSSSRSLPSSRSPPCSANAPSNAPSTSTTQLERS